MVRDIEDSGKTPPAVDTAEIVEGLNDLIKLDHDAIGSYEIAIDRLEDREHALQIEGFKRDHERHIRDLNEAVVQLGGTPANEPHATAPLKQALQQAAAAAGDRALLFAWRTNELQVMAKYDRYAQRATSWPAEIKRLVDQNALDEERHYQWVARITGSGETPELDVVNRLREGVGQARELSKHLQRTFEEASEGDLRGTLESQVRANPGASLGAGFVAGFFIGRLLS